MAIDDVVTAATGAATSAGSNGAAAAAFAAAWAPYLEHFVAWKSGDAALLERELVRIAVELEAGPRV